MMKIGVSINAGTDVVILTVQKRIWQQIWQKHLLNSHKITWTMGCGKKQRNVYISQIN